MKRLLFLLLLLSMSATAQPVVSVGPENILVPGFERPTAAEAGFAWEPVLAAARNHHGIHLVVWTARENGRTMIVGGLYSSDPNVVLPAILHHFTPPGNVAYPAVASNGDTFLLAWFNRPTGQILARRIDSAGDPLDAAPIIIDSAGGEPFAVTASGRDFVFVYGALGSRRARVAADGTLLERHVLFSAPGANRYDVASNGTTVLAATAYNDDGAPCLFLICSPSTRLRIVTANPLPEPILVGEESGPYGPFGPGVASDGRRFLAAWSNSTTIQGRFHDAAGEPHGTAFTITPMSVPHLLTPPRGSNIDVAWDSGIWAVAFEDLPTEWESNVRVAFVTANGTTFANEILGGTAQSERTPVIVADRGGFVVFYERAVSATHSEIVTRRIRVTTRNRSVRH